MINTLLGNMENQHDLEQSKKLIDEAIVATRREIQQLEQELVSCNTRKANLVAEYERSQARRMSGLWYFIILSLLVGEYMTINGGLLGWAIVCRYAFLINWRSLYVKQVPYARVVGLIVLGLLAFILVK